MTKKNVFLFFPPLKQGEVHPHGTPWRYFSNKCRCAPCTKAATRYSKEIRHERYEVPYEQKPHGTKNGYTNYGCRCPECTEAMRLWRRNHTPSPEAQQRRKEYVKAYKVRKRQEAANG